METFPRYCPFVRGIHRSPVNSPHKGQRRGAFMFSLICIINGWVNIGEAGDLRCHCTHCDVIVMEHVYWHKVQQSIKWNQINWPEQESLNNEFHCWCSICIAPQYYAWPSATHHYDAVIMGAMASQITSLTSVYSIIYSDADQGKHQSSASPAFVWGIHRGSVNSPHKWPVTRKMFPFDDVIMMSIRCCVWVNSRILISKRDNNRTPYHPPIPPSHSLLSHR